MPGPLDLEPLYAPALVGFSTYADIIGWFPLAPGEIYWPDYFFNENYFININLSNTVINRNRVIDYYLHPHRKMDYRNRKLPHAVTAVPKNAFINSKPVKKFAIKNAKEISSKTPVTHFPPLAPNRKSLLGNSNPAPYKLSEAIKTRKVVSKMQPPSPPSSFSSQEQQLRKNPGRPIGVKASGEKNNEISSVINVLHPPENLENRGRVNQRPVVMHHKPGYENKEPSNRSQISSEKQLRSETPSYQHFEAPERTREENYREPSTHETYRPHEETFHPMRNEVVRENIPEEHASPRIIEPMHFRK